ncbi:uncharacterized protein NPIL_78722 [Nephila pilipes]|uniref:Uncharacterized protein n=1 Tax=Nephila pilipes TaxID=299642 RepID=A0A8X6UCJ4_NEPPI|nr:uncharacterized protein NPIL_78722 [Nephila pilipes]
MKCPVSVQSCLCHEYTCADGYHIIPNSSHKNASEKSFDMFDLLSHNVPQCISKRRIENVNRLPTTYRTDYCRKKTLQTPTKAHSPYPGIFIPNQKMCTGTTHKNDFKPFNKKEGKDCRGNIVINKGSITCSNARFQGKSETKAVFSYPIPKKAVGPHDCSAALLMQCPSSGRKKASDVSMQTSTTYTLSYKKPKNIQKSIAWKPKLPITPKSGLKFKYISQYQDDYKKSKQLKRYEFIKNIVYLIFKYIPLKRPSNGKDYGF